jgi:UDP-N-acetylglucosamine 2-epimerase (non-hydrolysing)
MTMNNQRYKITTILGTRPEIIRLSEIIKRLDYVSELYVLDTNQNFTSNLNSEFYKELSIRLPDKTLAAQHSTLAGFLANLFIEVEKHLISHKPDAVLILGDTNSGLASVICQRLGVPVYHLEAGNRAFDANVPEELNRKIIDHASMFNLVYSEHSRRNLLSEGIASRRISLIGSPLFEVVTSQLKNIESSDILKNLKLVKEEYFLVSAHRQENVDNEKRLNLLIDSLEAVARNFGKRIIVSTHPRTRSKILLLDRKIDHLIEFHDPFGFFDYCKLQSNSKCVISDSGSISEEAAIIGFKAVTIRDSMERPEALETGAIVMSGLSPTGLINALTSIESSGLPVGKPWEYFVEDTSNRVVNFIFSTLPVYKTWFGIN